MLPDALPQAVFAGQAQEIVVTLRNTTAHHLAGEFSTRLFQLATNISAPVGDPIPWKKVELLAGQTARDQVRVAMPEVRVVTRFRIQLRDEAREVVGHVDVSAVPRDWLKQLGDLAGGERIAVLDPEGHLQPLLESAGLGVENLDAGEIARSAVSLAILGPFSDRAHLPEGTAQQARALAARGIAVIALLPLGSLPTLLIQPSRPDGSKLIVAPAAPFFAMATSPQAQLDLILLARLALEKTADTPLREWIEPTP